MANTSTFSSTSTMTAAALLSDRDLLDATARAAGDERRTTAELLALLAELDTRKLYLGEGYSSLFTYCTLRLRLSESAAYGRITAARAARRYPILLTRLADGDVTLTTISLLAAHLTDENHEPLLDAARHASKRDVERLVASLYAQPDIPASVRKIPGGVPCVGGGGLPAPAHTDEPPLALLAGSAARKPPCDELASANAVLPSPAHAATVASSPPAPTRAAHRPAVAPLAADRYLLRVTVGASTHAKLERARDLLRHSIPNGDPALIVDRALTVLVDQLEKRKTGRVSRPNHAVGARSTTKRTGPGAKRPRGRHVPAAVKRVVWTRDHGRCAFVGPHGRCSETGCLEYHHVLPFAAGGATDAANLELRCRAHNAYEATVWFGEEDRPGAQAPGR